MIRALALMAMCALAVAPVSAAAGGNDAATSKKYTAEKKRATDKRRSLKGAATTTIPEGFETIMCEDLCREFGICCKPPRQ